MLTTRGQHAVTAFGLRKLSLGSPRILYRAKSRFVHPDGVPAYEDNFLPEAVYPPIDTVWNRRSEANQKRHHDYLDWQKSIRMAKTIEGKAIEFNMPQIDLNPNDLDYMCRYGFYCFMLGEDVVHYDSLDFHKYITRTHLMSESENPDSYSSPELIEKVKHFSEKLSGPLLDVLKFEFDGIERRPIEDELIQEKVKRETSSVVNQVSRLILQVLSNEDPYFQKVQVDYEPKTEAFWLVGGFARSKLRKKQLKNRSKVVKYRDQVVKETDPVELNFQYMGKPIVQIRSEYPVGRLMDEEELLHLEDAPLNRFDYYPQDYYAYKKLRHPTHVAGHWSGDQAKCNLITFHSSHHLYSGQEKRLNNSALQARSQNLLHSQGVLVSFTKLLAQAYALGFDQFGELAEPLPSQTIITDGRDWSFYAYQLNTMQVDKLSIDANKKQNVCWGTRTMSILDGEGKLNQSVLEMLLKFYLQPTLTERIKPVMPYVKTTLNEMTDDVDRRFIHCNYTNMYSQKGLVLDPHPEMYLWEKLFKVDNKTRPLDARRKFFELPDANPYWERYRLLDPRIESKMLTKLKKELAEKKEAEKLEALRAEQKARFHQVDQDDD